MPQIADNHYSRLPSKCSLPDSRQDRCLKINIVDSFPCCNRRNRCGEVVCSSGWQATISLFPQVVNDDEHFTEAAN